MKRSLLLLFAFILFFSGCQSSCQKKDRKSPESAPAAADYPSKTQQEESKVYQLKVTYPVTGNAAVDGVIDGFVKNQISEFKKDMTVGDMPAEARNEIQIDYSVSSFDDQYKSFRFEVMTYTGGAHPNTDILTRTFDMKSGKLISLSDLFKPGSDYLNALSRIAFDQIKAKVENTDAGWVKKGTAPTAENYGAFLLDEKDLVIVFQAYQVAPYVEGPQEVKIPYAQLKDSLNPPFSGK
ncbi:MAG: DUF3298 and DUF4163 domain-containing protein [bacterium]